MSAFLLTPPFAISVDVAVSLIKLEDMDSPESLVINLGGWTAAELLAHWYTEVSSLVDKRRNCCCIVSGLSRVADKIVPTEWWKLFLVKGEVKIQYQVIVPEETDSLDQWSNSDLWWKNIPKYYPFYYDEVEKRQIQISEWSVSLANLESWCSQHAALLRLIQSAQEEIDSESDTDPSEPS